MPTQRKMYIGTNEGTPGPTTTIQAKRMLSPINHRLYRSGRTYVQKIDMDPNSPNIIEVYALADTWMVHNAWKLAFETYQRHNSDEIKAAGKNRARWSDFQVGFDIGNLGLPQQYDSALNPGVYTAGEFEVSTVADDDNNVFTFDWLSAAGTNINILDQYDLAGRTQVTPEDTETSAPYQTLNNDELDTQVFRDIQQHGDVPPYNADFIGTNTPLVKIATLQGLSTATTGVARLSTGYFRAPCGIVVLHPAVGGGSAHTGDLSVTYKEGNYKGVHAVPMGE